MVIMAGHGMESSGTAGSGKDWFGEARYGKVFIFCLLSDRMV